MGKPFLSGGNDFKRANNVPLSKKEAKADGVDCFPLKASIKRNLRIQDEQEYCNQLSWFNTNLSLSSTEIERMFYYKGSLMLFKMNDEFYLMPYTLDGGLNYYGQYKTVHPVPMVWDSDDAKTKAEKEVQAIALSKMKYTVVREVMLEEDFINEDGIFDIDKAKDFLDHACVIINDYTPQISQVVTPRYQLQEGIIDVESDCIPFMRTALLNSTGVMGLKVNSEDEKQSVEIASKSIDQAALSGNKYVPVVGGLDFQALTDGSAGTADQFMLAMQSLDNLRHTFLGIDNAGLFQKSQFMTNDQNQVNMGNIGLLLQDKLANRQRACDIANSLWGIDIWCEPSECITMADTNMDGFLGEEKDQSGEFKGEQPEGGTDVL